MAAELGSTLDAALREIIRQVVREELGLSSGMPTAVDDDDDIGQLAALRAAKRRATGDEAMKGRINAGAVRAELTGDGVLMFYGQEVRGGRTIQLREGPRCKRRQRRIACKVDRDTGRWIHHSGPGGAAVCKRDALELVAAFEGLDTRTQFPAVLSRAAQLAGITPDSDPAELGRIRAAHEAARQVRDRRAADELVLEESVRAIELGEHHDLADAWRAGWRGAWTARLTRTRSRRCNVMSAAQKGRAP